MAQWGTIIRLVGKGQSVASLICLSSVSVAICFRLPNYVDDRIKRTPEPRELIRSRSCLCLVTGVGGRRALSRQTRRQPRLT